MLFASNNSTAYGLNAAKERPPTGTPTVGSTPTITATLTITVTPSPTMTPTVGPSPTPTPGGTCSGTQRIMPLGDSITFGTYGSGDNRPSSLVTGYRQPLYLSLSGANHDIDFVGGLIAGQSANPAFDADHEGHSGWTAPQVAATVYDWLVANPTDIILLHIGTNNLTTSSIHVESILDEIDRYEDDYNVEITVVLARIINRVYYSSRTTAFNQNVAAMAQSRIANGDNIVLVNMESALNYSTDMVDNLHPNETGYNKMATVWFVALDALLSGCESGTTNNTVSASTNGAALLPTPLSTPAH